MIGSKYLRQSTNIKTILGLKETLLDGTCDYPNQYKIFVTHTY